MSTTNSFPTPASSVSGHHGNATSAEDMDLGGKTFSTGTHDSAATSGAGPAQQSKQHRPTDHDRQSFQTDGANGFATGQAQQSTDPDAMDVDTKPTHQAELTFSLDSLQKELTSAFHLCKSCKVPQTEPRRPLWAAA